MPLNTQGDRTGGGKGPTPKKVKLVFPKKAKSYESLVKGAPKSSFPKPAAPARVHVQGPPAPGKTSTPTVVPKTKAVHVQGPPAPGRKKTPTVRVKVKPDAAAVVRDTVKAIQSNPDQADAQAAKRREAIKTITGSDGRVKPKEKRGSLLGNAVRNARDIVESAPTVAGSSLKLAGHALGQAGEDVINLGPGTRSNKMRRALDKDVANIRQGVKDSNPFYHAAEAGVAAVKGDSKQAKKKIHQALEEAHKRPVDVALTVLPAAKALDTAAGGAVTAAKAARAAEVKAAKGAAAKAKALKAEAKGAHALRQARPDKVVRASPRKASVNQLHRDRVKARVAKADRMEGHAPHTPPERVLASKPQTYSKGLVKRAAQRARENHKAAAGVDPTEIKGARRRARAVKKDAATARRNQAAANVAREGSEARAQQQADKHLGRKHRDLKNELVDLIANGAVKKGSEAKDLHDLAVAARKRGGAGNDRNAQVYDHIASKLSQADVARAHEVAAARVPRAHTVEDRLAAHGYFDGTDPKFVRGVQAEILKGNVHKVTAKKGKGQAAAPKTGRVKVKNARPAPDGAPTSPRAASGPQGTAAPRTGGFQGRPAQGASDGSQVSGATQHVPAGQAEAAAKQLEREQRRANAAVRAGHHRARIAHYERLDKKNNAMILKLLDRYGRTVKTASGGVRRSVAHSEVPQRVLQKLRTNEHAIGQKLQQHRDHLAAAEADAAIPAQTRASGLSGGSGNRRSDSVQASGDPARQAAAAAKPLKRNASAYEIQAHGAHLAEAAKPLQEAVDRLTARVASAEHASKPHLKGGIDPKIQRIRDTLEKQGGLRDQLATAQRELADHQLRQKAVAKRQAASDQLAARDRRGEATSPPPSTELPGAVGKPAPPPMKEGGSTPTPTPAPVKAPDGAKPDPAAPGGFVWTKGPHKGKPVTNDQLNTDAQFIRGLPPEGKGTPPAGPNARAARKGYSDVDTLLKQAGVGRGNATILESHRILGQVEMAKMFQQRYGARNAQGAHLLNAEDATKVAAVRNKTGQLEWEPVRLNDKQFVVLPKVVNDLWKEHQKPLRGIEHAGHILGRQFVRTILPFSVSWHAGNVADLTTRLVLSGAFGRGHWNRQQITAALDAAMTHLDPHLRDTAMSAIQGHLGSQHTMRAPRWSDMSEPGKKSLGNAMSSWRKLPGAQSAADGYGAAVERAFAASTRLESRLTNSAAGLAAEKYARELGIATKDHVKMAEQLAGEFKNDPRKLEEFQRRTLEITGDYVTKTGAERKLANTIAPFYTWLRAANTFVFRTLPKNHPYKTALMLQAASISEPERRKLGLSYYLSAAETKRLGLPQQKRDYYMGAVPVGKVGKLMPMTPLTSFGEAGKLLDLVTGEGGGALDTSLAAGGTLGGPGVGGIVRGAIKAHQGGPMTQGQVALSRAIEAYFPGTRQLRKVGENGGASHSSSTFWAPVSNASGKPFDPLTTAAKVLAVPIPGRPFGESKKQAQQRKMNALGVYPPGGIMHLTLPNGKVIDITKGSHAPASPAPVGPELGSAAALREIQQSHRPGPIPASPGSFQQRLAALKKMPAGPGHDEAARVLQQDIARHLRYLKGKDGKSISPALIEHKSFALNKGGNIVAVPGAPGEEAARSVIPDIEKTIKRFDVLLTDAYDRDHSAGHKSPGHNVTGTAADFAGSDKAMGEAAHYWASKGYIVGYDGTGGTQDWPGHGPSTKVGANAHLHVEFGSPANAGLNGAAAPASGGGPAPDPTSFAPAPQTGKITKKATATVTSGANMAWRVQARREAIKHGIDPDVYERQIQQESSFTNPGDNSSGAAGVAQFIRGTAEANGLHDRNDVKASLAAGARLMASLVKQYGSYERALSAYNSGRPDAYQDPGFAKGQTYNYVKIILGGHGGALDNMAPADSLASAPMTGGGGGSTPTPRKIYAKVTPAQHQKNLAAAKKLKVRQVLDARKATNGDSTLPSVTAPDRARQLQVLMHALQDGKLTVQDVLDLNAAG